MQIWDAINNPEYRDCTPSWNDQDLMVVGDAERALHDGLKLKQWWRQQEAEGAYAESFELVRTFNRASRVTGFFDTASLNGKDLPVMGIVQEMVFDKAKQAHPESVRDELREFILHYFMRVSATREPQAFIPRDQLTKADVRTVLQPFSFCPEPLDTQAGFGYSQLYYQLREPSYTGKFPVHLRPRIADLRRLDDIYKWIVMQVNILDFNLTYLPFANGSFSLDFPQKEETYIATSRDFITSEDNPTPDLLGRYGIGYALLKPAPHKTIFAYGPGHFSAGFQTIDFEIDRAGESRVRMVFCANRPTNVVDVDFNPVSWGFSLADQLSFGWTSRLFGPIKHVLERFSPRLESLDPVTIYMNFINLVTDGLSRKQLCSSLTALERNPMLLTHFMEHYTLISGALMTWRNVQSWLDPEEVPAAVREGTCS